MPRVVVVMLIVNKYIGVFVAGWLKNIEKKEKKEIPRFLEVVKHKPNYKIQITVSPGNDLDG